MGRGLRVFLAEVAVRHLMSVSHFCRDFREVAPGPAAWRNWLGPLEEFHRCVECPHGCLVYIELSELGITRLDAERAVIADALERGDESADVEIAVSWK